MREGIIKRIVADRGFGFISGDREDVFFHFSAVQEINFDDLQEGQVVQFEVEAARAVDEARDRVLRW